MAVYTEVNDDELSAFLTQYDLGQLLSYKGIAEGVENSNFLLQTDQGNFILTLYEKRTKKEDLPFFLDLMDHLAASDFACPTPVHGRDGKALKTLAGRPAAIVSFLNGVWPRRIQPYHTAALGKAMAQMHLASEAFTQTRSNDLGLAQWRPLFNQISANVDDISKGLGDEIMTELDALEANWPEGLPHGIIHADLFPDNVFFLGKDFSGFIDFYFSCTDSYAYDLAICLNAWCFEPDRQFNVTKARHMLQAYQQIRPLSEAEMLALPALARGAALRFLLTRLYDWLNTPSGALVKPHDPLQFRDYLRFHKGIKGLAAYGLEL